LFIYNTFVIFRGRDYQQAIAFQWVPALSVFSTSVIRVKQTVHGFRYC